MLNKCHVSERVYEVRLCVHYAYAISYDENILEVTRELKRRAGLADGLVHGRRPPLQWRAVVHLIVVSRDVWMGVIPRNAFGPRRTAGAVVGAAHRIFERTAAPTATRKFGTTARSRKWARGVIILRPIGHTYLRPSIRDGIRDGSNDQGKQRSLEEPQHGDVAVL
jgi:hypothetical protein